mmetsp:Transcript_27158/g.85474  ORF Transcript_27158/g.85474 Transcript_27158/m.85474 type:complete len:245 (-) Transcript_27158:452-1186(-)
MESRGALRALLDTPSRFRGDGGPVEGVYLRYEGDDGELRRCKLVRPDFVQGIHLHWSTQMQAKQTVDVELRETYLDECYCEAIEEPLVDAPQQPPVEQVDPRSRVTVSTATGEDVVLQRNFSWLVPGQIAVSSTPKLAEQIEAMRDALGVTLVVTLTEVTSLSPKPKPKPTPKPKPEPRPKPKPNPLGGAAEARMVRRRHREPVRARAQLLPALHRADGRHRRAGGGGGAPRRARHGTLRRRQG